MGFGTPTVLEGFIPESQGKTAREAGRPLPSLLVGKQARNRFSRAHFRRGPTVYGDR
ncbi:hypothetical protein A176_007652 [Myxococcus hansupus]|uniref:Uncharacterized protein n=1 Tax=Pseudomyxococcus hansupus TaxID=1297742 RepID=A0A0H4XAN5_9BACT|nr:hypothetical protein A176_007652 [Myxococcus hansupus]